MFNKLLMLDIIFSSFKAKKSNEKEEIVNVCMNIFAAVDSITLFFLCLFQIYHYCL